MVAEIRDGVVSGEATSALKAGFSAAASDPGSASERAVVQAHPKWIAKL